MAALTISDLFKPDSSLKHELRLDIFIEKYKNQEFFTLRNGESIKLNLENPILSKLESRDRTQLRGLKFNKTIALTDLEKTPEFGGRGFSSTRDEDAALTILQKEIKSTISKLIGRYVPIKVNGIIYKASAIESTPGTPKSDFHLVDINGNPCVHISHKKGSKPTDFQQWSGITEVQIREHDETEEFAYKLRNKYPNGVPSKTNVWMPIKDELLLRQSMYGVDFDFNPSAISPNNCNVILQGKPDIKRVGDYWELKANHVLKSGEIPSLEYLPTFVATMRSDRNNLGLPKTRVFIYPREGRKLIDSDKLV